MKNARVIITNSMEMNAESVGNCGGIIGVSLGHEMVNMEKLNTNFGDSRRHIPNQNVGRNYHALGRHLQWMSRYLSRSDTLDF